jgi:hypothetical protein
MCPKSAFLNWTRSLKNRHSGRDPESSAFYSLSGRDQKFTILSFDPSRRHPFFSGFTSVAIVSSNKTSPCHHAEILLIILSINPFAGLPALPVQYGKMWCRFHDSIMDRGMQWFRCRQSCMLFAEIPEKRLSISLITSVCSV